MSDKVLSGPDLPIITNSKQLLAANLHAGRRDLFEDIAAMAHVVQIGTRFAIAVLTRAIDAVYAPHPPFVETLFLR